MLLSDGAIRSALAMGEIDVCPFVQENLQPASLDLTLDSTYRVPRLDVGCIDVAEVPEGHTRELCDDFVIPLEPGDFILACTREVVRLGPAYAARVEGRSSIGRLGVQIHTTAGFIDPGFEGQITLEITNVAPWEVHLRPGMRIAQLAVMRMWGTPLADYSAKGHYQGQRGPTESRFKL